MKLKEGVTLHKIMPQTVLAINIAEGIYNIHGIEMVITSVSDGKHSINSLHYMGFAFDTRIREIPQATLNAIFNDIKTALGKNYDVVLESTHIHIEYDPK